MRSMSRTELAVIFASLALAGCSEGEDDTSSAGGGFAYVPPARDALDVVDQKRVWSDGCAFLDLVGGEAEEGKNRYSLPFLTIYGPNGALYHQAGFLNEDSVETWIAVVDGEVTGLAAGAPSLPEVLLQSRTGDLSDAEPEADVLFVRYAADWCAPCKGQSAAIREFRSVRPDLKVIHYEVEADMMKWNEEEPMACDAA